MTRRACLVSSAALRAGSGTVLVPVTGVTGVVAGVGSVPVVVSSPNVCPPRVTPSVALTLGAWRVSSAPAVVAPDTETETSCSALGSLLMSVTRTAPSPPCVAHTFTGPDGAVLCSSRAPAGNAWSNMSRP